jgi:hypothetical protein
MEVNWEKRKCDLETSDTRLDMAGVVQNQWH